jgi:sigma-70-like protein/RNA polymerase alpha subunit
MHEIYKAEAIDIGGLRWGSRPVPLLPKSLTDLWNEEALPVWLIAECGLNVNATIAALGPGFWNSSNHFSPRVEHFVEFLIRSRVRSIESIRCLNLPWPVGLEVADIPFGARATNALKAAGLYDSKEKLSEVTFGQLLRIPNLGSKSLLEVTTLLESSLELHWQITAELARSFATPAGDKSRDQANELSTPDARYEIVDKKWSAQLTEALREPWIDQIDEHDPRFRTLFPNGYGSLEERIERTISDPVSASAAVVTLVSSVSNIRAAVERLDSQMLEDSLRELLALYVGNDQARLDAIAGRLGWLGHDPKTLQECGDSLGVTRERVRQIEAKFIKRITNRSIYLPKLDAGLTELEASTPLAFGKAAQLLMDKGISRKPFSPAALLSTARLLGRRTTLSVQEFEGERFVVAGAQGEVLGVLTRTARKLAGKSGVASIFQLADTIVELFAPKYPPDIGEDGIRKILRNQEGCEFLNEDWFWFTDIPQGRNRLENVIKKILSVASPQSVASIREGVRRVFRWRQSTNERYRSLVVPPQAVLGGFLDHHPEFHLSGEMASSVKPLDYRKLLGEGEQALVDVLRGVSSGVVDRRTLIRECLSRGINENTLAIYTTYSPILEHIGIDLWQLRGVHVDPAAVEAVREQNALRPREQRVQDFGWSQNGRLWVAWILPHLTGSPVLGIPGAVGRYVSGRSFSAKPKHVDRSAGKISVNDDGTSYGYAAFFRYIGADEGDLLLAEFDLAKSDVELSINDFDMLQEASA